MSDKFDKFMKQFDEEKAERNFYVALMFLCVITFIAVVIALAAQFGKGY